MSLFQYFLCLLVLLPFSPTPSEGRRKKRCRLVDPWTIGGGNPIMGSEGFTTILYILSKNLHSNAYQLRALNEYGYHYKHRLRQRVRIMALNPIGYPKVTRDVRREYPYIRLLQEPNDGQQIFRRLGGYERDLLIYDECSRLSYQYGFPYSYMGFPWVSHALTTVIRQHESICGPCRSQQAFLAGRMAKALVSNKRRKEEKEKRRKKRRRRRKRKY